MREFKDGSIVLARLINESDIKEGLNFFSQDEEFIQVGFWHYERGKKLLAHRHNHAPREVAFTQEVLFIKNGKIRAKIYDLNDAQVAEFEAKSGDILVMLNGGHGYEILENDTQVLEIKNGPYLGADIDRRRLENA